MNIGMLWFDNDPKTDLNGKIERAAAYYRSKYGQSPNLCFVHPSMLADRVSKPEKMEVRANQSRPPEPFLDRIRCPQHEHGSTRSRLVTFHQVFSAH